MKFKLGFLAGWIAIASVSSAGASTPPALGEAGKILTRFCEVDGKGTFLNSGTWDTMKEMAIWEDAPGWDTHYFVRECKVVKEKYNSAKNKATVTVEYHFAGERAFVRDEKHHLPETYKAYDKIEKVPFKLRLIQGKWLIEAPQLAPHVYVTPEIEAKLKLVSEAK